MTRVLVVLNSPTSSMGRLEQLLPEEGLDPVLTPAAELPGTLDGFAGVVLLGGGFMPDDDAAHPFLAHERRLTTQALDDGVPLLGLCLGGQLLAHVTGGGVTARSGETERGMCALTVLPAAAGDPVFGAVARPGSPLWMIENHEDSVTALPPSATLLVSSDACRVQAFRVGEAAWGLQFHPEARPERVATWDEAALSEQGIDRAALAAAAMEHAAENEAQSRALVGGWADVVREAAG
ncbi:type 1 glutamine amidotransferase [Promicromonospora thailandica]|uniref:GMP synthase - Glutamine amidotransferase n=1 Tax=Promicromonospora thailandica TaxID=765201 RepID=A0A9X2G0E2_9MICO|nr:type 1 glutamine amidotransferase [Promicromonospora thailandica]MCP2264509.1 GMP synthase - Glutamine amidotransferase [Promicromonospora thailandica]BFF20431.1 type 1 glutamine amidotransferase [Promicromonospora thailandica]